MFPGVVTPSSQKLSREVGVFASENFAHIGEFPEGDLKVDFWDVGKVHLDVIICDVIFSHFAHSYPKDAKNGLMEEHVELFEEGLASRPALTTPEKKITRNGTE